MSDLWGDLDRFAVKKYSQSGEEGIIQHILENIDLTGRYHVVDIGAGDGFTLSNTRQLIEETWQGTLFDVGKHTGVIQAMFDGNNAAQLLKEHGVAKDFDLLSLDIDGQDFWVLQRILREGYRPRVIVAEINGSRPAWPAVTVPFYPPWAHDGTNYYGMSLGAVAELGAYFDYQVVHQRMSLNAFLVRKALLPADIQLDIPFELNHGHFPDTQNRPWHEVTPEDFIR